MKATKMVASYIEEREKEIKRLNGAVPIFSSQACLAWRAQHEGTDPPPEASSDDDDDDDDDGLD